MSKDVNKIFINWLIENHLYSDFEKEVKAHWNKTIDEYLNMLPNQSSFPGYFIYYGLKDNFSSSVTQAADKAHDFWNSVHWRWKAYLNMKDLPDASEFYGD